MCGPHLKGRRIVFQALALLLCCWYLFVWAWGPDRHYSSSPFPRERKIIAIQQIQFRDLIKTVIHNQIKSTVKDTQFNLENT